MARIDPAQIPRPVVNQSQEVQVGCAALWQHYWGCFSSVAAATRLLC
jgi:hypothetical protein